jgi:hypothetical protein
VNVKAKKDHAPVDGRGQLFPSYWLLRKLAASPRGRSLASSHASSATPTSGSANFSISWAPSGSDIRVILQVAALSGLQNTRVTIVIARPNSG